MKHQDTIALDPVQQPEARTAGTGILYALAAFFTWGLVVPLHFKLLSSVPPFQILAYRIVWATLFALGLIAFRRQLAHLIEVLTFGRRLGLLCVSAGLIGMNWLVYIWAVNNGHLVQTSLGYFINPLINVALGVLVLRERLHPAQVIACGLAGAGVVALAVSSGEVPWVALTLAFSFGFYSLVRKTVQVGPLVGFCVESLLLSPLALSYCAFTFGQGTATAFQGDWSRDVLLVLTGLTTAAPLIWFAAAAQRLTLSTLGLLQYLAPTGQLALGVLVYGEAFGWIDAMAFSAIWTALAVYSAGALKSSASRPASRPASRA
ncbi:EamA family transporter RarD [Microvirga sp. TS319]|uniref:EamA family transporter RarD n=1 Tax=Microvirga sp. TS319 TaxID=3241165 RepID=UPI00351A777C